MLTLAGFFWVLFKPTAATGSAGEIFEQPLLPHPGRPCGHLHHRPTNGLARHLKQLVTVGVLVEMVFGRERLFIHPKLMKFLVQEANVFTPHSEVSKAP